MSTQDSARTTRKMHASSTAQPEPEVDQTPRKRRRAFEACTARLREVAVGSNAEHLGDIRNIFPPPRPLNYPFIFAHYGFSMVEAQLLNPGLSVNRWCERTFKENLRRQAVRNSGSAFKLDYVRKFKGLIYLLEGESCYIASDHCRTMHRVSCYASSEARLKELYSVRGSSASVPATVHAALFVPLTMGKGALDESDGCLSEWLKETVHQTDLLITTEKSKRKNENFFRVSSVLTGEELLSVWLSTSPLLYKDLAFHNGMERISVTSCLDSGKKLGGGVAVIFWNVFPFRYGGGFFVKKAVFGDDVTSVGDVGQLLVVFHRNRSAGRPACLYDLRPFLNAPKPYDVVVGNQWDRKRFPLGTNGKLPNLPNVDLRYGVEACGMPFSYEFKHKPALLYKVYTSEEVLYLPLRRQFILIGDKKSKEFRLIDVFTGQQIPGPKLQTRNPSQEFEVEFGDVTLVQSQPERLAVWTGFHLKLYGVHAVENGGGSLELREDFSFIPPAVIPGSTVRPEWDVSPVVEYDYSFNILTVIFRDQTTSGRVVKVIDAQFGTVLSTTVLTGKEEMGTESVSVGDCGMLHTQQHHGGTIVTFYSNANLVN